MDKIDFLCVGGKENIFIFIYIYHKRAKEVTKRVRNAVTSVHRFYETANR